MKKFIIALLVLVLALSSAAFGASEFDETWLVTAQLKEQPVRCSCSLCRRKSKPLMPDW